MNRRGIKNNYSNDNLFSTIQNYHIWYKELFHFQHGEPGLWKDGSRQRILERIADGQCRVNKCNRLIKHTIAILTYKTYLQLRDKTYLQFRDETYLQLQDKTYLQ